MVTDKIDGYQGRIYEELLQDAYEAMTTTEKMGMKYMPFIFWRKSKIPLGVRARSGAMHLGHTHDICYSVHSKENVRLQPRCFSLRSSTSSVNGGLRALKHFIGLDLMHVVDATEMMMVVVVVVVSSRVEVGEGAGGRGPSLKRPARGQARRRGRPRA